MTSQSPYMEMDCLFTSIYRDFVTSMTPYYSRVDINIHAMFNGGIGLKAPLSPNEGIGFKIITVGIHIVSVCKDFNVLEHALG